ncbi:MAG: AarF/UbiB family protein, partial [Pseudobdellovibrionaceae bacterium]
MLSARILTLFLSALFWLNFSWAVPSAKRPLYLSFEKRLIMTYLLAGAGETPEVQLQLASRLANTLKRYVHTDVERKKVRNFQEFLKVYRGDWPGSYSVQSDLKLIESQAMQGPVLFEAVDSSGRFNPALDSQIKGFMRQQNEMLLERTTFQDHPMTGLAQVSASMMDIAIKGPISQTLILQGFEKVTELTNQQFAKLEKVGEQMAASGKLSRLQPSVRLFLESVLQNYFSRLGLNSKKQLVSRFLGENLNADPMQRFEIMLMSGGPQFQKLLQIIAGNSDVSADLQKILKKLESRVSPIPAPIVRQLFEAERERYKWISYNLEPLGTGTMAQVHKGRIRTQLGEEDIVIRFLKPEIDNRVQEDARILTEIARIMDSDERFRSVGLPRLKPVIEDLNKTVTDELDLRATIQRQVLGQKVYSRRQILNTGNYKNELVISVPKVYDGGVGSNLMVQQLIEGRKFESEMLVYTETIPQLGKGIVEAMAKMWAEEVFFKSGFYHSDLH